MLDKTTTDLGAMEAILRHGDLGFLGLHAEGETYVIPITYTYANGRVLMHCALEGRKLSMIRANPDVCFTVARQEGRPAPHAGDICDNAFESVVCWGKARVVDSVGERVATLNEFQERYSSPSNPREPIGIERARKCGAIEVRIERMTGRRGGAEKASWSCSIG